MSKQDIRVLNSKGRILKIAGELFSEFGFLGVSMAEIAKRLNITKPALYYHFRSKKDLYLKVLEDSFRNLIKSLNKVTNKVKSPEQRLSQAIYIYLKFGLKEKNLIKSLTATSSKMDPEIREYITKSRREIGGYFQRPLEEILKKKNPKKFDLRFITTGLLGIMDRLIIEAVFLNKKLGIKKRASQILEIVSLILKGRRKKSLIKPYQT